MLGEEDCEVVSPCLRSIQRTRGDEIRRFVALDFEFAKLLGSDYRPDLYNVLKVLWAAWAEIAGMSWWSRLSGFVTVTFVWGTSSFKYGVPFAANVHDNNWYEHFGNSNAPPDAATHRARFARHEMPAQVCQNPLVECSR
jgi:hypothetical protein